MPSEETKVNTKGFFDANMLITNILQTRVIHRQEDSQDEVDIN